MLAGTFWLGTLAFTSAVLAHATKAAAITLAVAVVAMVSWRYL